MPDVTEISRLGRVVAVGAMLVLLAGVVTVGVHAGIMSSPAAAGAAGDPGDDDAVAADDVALAPASYTWQQLQARGLEAINRSVSAVAAPLWAWQLRAEQDAAARQAAEEARREAERRARERQRQLVAAQERLQELGYLIGPADGEQGQQTTTALMAFQAVNGISVDGILGPQTIAQLDNPVQPSLRGGPATRIEVDLDLQVIHLVEGGQRVVTFKTSSGNGATYSRSDGSTSVANSPVGNFTIERRIAGRRESSAGLGTLFDPMYYYGGFAIHGSGSVRPREASHGCLRLSMADAPWLFGRVPNGTPVQIHGGRYVFTAG